MFCDASMEIQSFIFSRRRFTMRSAIDWLVEHDARIVKAHETEGAIRFRQHPTTRYIAGSFRTIHLSKDIAAVVACPKG